MTVTSSRKAPRSLLHGSILPGMPIDTSIDPEAPEELYVSIPLKTCLLVLPKRVEACRQKRTFRSVVEVCSICRSTWAAYLLEWGSSRLDVCRAQVEAGLSASAGVVSEVSAGLSGEDHLLAQHYLENIQLRLHLVQVLHSQGVEAAKREMRQRWEQPVALAA